MFQRQSKITRKPGLPAGLLAALMTIYASVAVAEEASATDSMKNVQAGQTLYVDDQLWITVRTAPNEQGERISVIPSGTQMTLLEHNDGDDYAKVELTSSDKTGWVLFRYLTDKPIAKLQLAAAEENTAKLQNRNDELKASLSKTREERRTLEEQNRKLEQEQTALSKELEELKSISKDAVDTFNEKRQLELQAQNQQQQIATLSESRDSLQAKLLMYSGISGVICLLLGLYIGTIPIRREKRWQRMP